MDLNDNDAAGGNEEVEPAPYQFTRFTGIGCRRVPCSWSGFGTILDDNRFQNAVQAFWKRLTRIVR